MAGRDVPMSIRRLIVEVSTDGLNVRRFCAEHGVSTWLFYDLRRRYALDGDDALEPRSRAPHVVANKTDLAVEDAIVAKRKELADAGLDDGAESIRFHLRALPGVPSTSTIYRILKARGFVVPVPAKAPKRTARRFTAERANETWGLDDTAWELADGTEVKILNVIDDHSRLLVASTVMMSCTGAATLSTVAEAAQVVGWPARFFSDNAKAFRHVLADALRPIGIAAGHSRPYHPQTNGKVERFHQTLKKWLTRQPAAATPAELQHQLDLFRLLYNHHRPHRGINRGIPADVWAAAPKAGPADRPLGTPSTTHHSTITNGTCRAGRYSISIGAAHNGRRALTVITGLACHVFIDGRLTRDLTLDPTRRVQPLHPRPGRPAKL
jgi:transposase InsO family protein